MPRTVRTPIHPAARAGYSKVGELTERSSLAGFRVTLVHDDVIKAPVRDRSFWAKGVSP